MPQGAHLKIAICDQDERLTWLDLATDYLCRPNGKTDVSKRRLFTTSWPDGLWRPQRTADETKRYSDGDDYKRHGMTVLEPNSCLKITRTDDGREFVTINFDQSSASAVIANVVDTPDHPVENSEVAYVPDGLKRLPDQDSAAVSVEVSDEPVEDLNPLPSITSNGIFRRFCGNTKNIFFCCSCVTEDTIKNCMV